MLKLFLGVTCILITTDVVHCKPEYVFNAQLPGWFALHIIPDTWEEAFLRCHFEGATLASPINDNMTSLLHNIISESKIVRRFFLGTHALFSDGDFVSIEGVSLGSMPIKNRNVQSENDDSCTIPPLESVTAQPGSCLTMDTNGSEAYVYTSSCTEKHPYVCYRKMKNEKLNQCGTFDNSYRLNEHTGSCYKFHRNHQTWSRANMICTAEGGYLVILNNVEEALFIRGMFPNDNNKDPYRPLYIGLRAWSKDRFWLTNHGESVDDVYNSWNPGEPNNQGGVQYCGAVLKAGMIDDISCQMRAIFVCEKDPKRIMFDLPSN